MTPLKPQESARAAPLTCHRRFSTKLRLHALCKILPAMLGAAFDLVCSLRPLPLCGGVSGLPLYEIIGVSEALVDVVFADDDVGRQDI